MNKNTKTNENKGKLVIEKRVSFVKPIELVLYLYFLSIMRASTADVAKKMPFYNTKDLLYYFITSFYNISFIRCFILQFYTLK